MVGVFEREGVKAMRAFEGLRMGEYLIWKRLALGKGNFARIAARILHCYMLKPPSSEVKLILASPHPLSRSTHSDNVFPIGFVLAATTIPIGNAAAPSVLAVAPQSC